MRASALMCAGCCGGAAPVLPVLEQTQSELPLILTTLHAAVWVPSQKAGGDQAFNEMRREPKAALFVQLSLTEGCLWQSVGQRVPSTAVRTPVPVRSRPNPKGWGVQCAGTLQEVSKTVRGFSRLALLALVRMGKPVSEWGSGRAQTAAGQSCSCPGSCTFSPTSPTSPSIPVGFWHS